MRRPSSLTRVSVRGLRPAAPASLALDGVGAEAGDDLDVAGGDGSPGAGSECAAGGQLVGVAAAVDVADDAAAQHPDGGGARAGSRPGWPGRRGRSGRSARSRRPRCAGRRSGRRRRGRRGRGPGRRSGRRRPSRRRRGSRRRRAGSGSCRCRRRRRRRGPGSGTRSPSASAQVRGERLLVAAGVDDAVAAAAGDAGDGGVVDDPVAERVGEGLEVERWPTPRRWGTGRRRVRSTRSGPAGGAAAGSMSSAQREKSRTWPQPRTAAAACGPRSTTSGSRPRSSRWAAAARPIGPAPTTSVGNEVVSVSFSVWFAGRSRCGSRCRTWALRRDIGLIRRLSMSSHLAR